MTIPGRNTPRRDDSEDYLGVMCRQREHLLLAQSAPQPIEKVR